MDAVPDQPKEMQHEWDLPEVVRAKPESSDYGYVLNGQMFATTREGLIDAVQQGKEISFVWTPDTPGPVYPETVPFVLDALRVGHRRQGRIEILWGTGFIGIAALTSLVTGHWPFLYRNFLLVLGAVFLTEAIWTYVRASHYTETDAISDRSSARFAVWVKKKNLSGYSLTLAACIVVVAIIQPIAENSIEIAGLVKPAVWNGEIWRLFTATLMHANIMHFWMNSLGFIVLSKVVEQTVHRACVPIVFLLSAPVGSIFSVLLYPNTTSIGSSGGIMGLLGFITIAAYFDRRRYPSKYVRHMIEAIIFTGVMGLFGFAFIDNAAHLGGLVGGLFVGWVLFRNERLIKEKQELLDYAGVVALVGLALIAVSAVYRITR